MTTAQQVVVGVFDDRTQAEGAVDELVQSGFSNDQIRYSGHGTSSGGVLETLKSLFTGHETDRVYDDLVGMGVQQDDANYYQHEFEAGHSIVSVLTADRAEDATSILEQYGGYGAGRSSDQAANYASSTYPQTDYDSTTSRTGPARADYATTTSGSDIPRTATGDEQRMKLREEQLNVQKQSVEAGEAHLRKNVVSEQQSIDVPVTHEEVYVKTRPGSGQPTDAPIGDGSETYRVPVREEQVTASKQTVEIGEVAIGKRQYQDTQHVSDTIQHEEAHLENSGDVNVRSRDIEDNVDQSDQSDL